jgi:uncharacterized protein YPO0396
VKRLEKILLIYWHNIKFEIIEFDGINFLTGKNKMGKSTIIDAIQLIMLGDTYGYYFNKAANDNSQRTLKGYLRGEIADDGGHGFIYLREGRFTSYIVAQFYDTIKKKYFSSGVVFDCYEDGTHEHKFFIIDDAIPDNHFMHKNIPMEYTQLKDYFKTKFKIKNPFFDSNINYQEALRHKFGGLKKNFFSLFKKSVPFTPITEIEKFISDFVCDVKYKVEIEDMKENIRYYEQLKQEAELTKSRIEELENIEQKYQYYQKEKKRYNEYNYLIDRSKIQVAIDKKNTLLEVIEENKIKLLELDEHLKYYHKRIKLLDSEIIKLYEKKINSGYESLQEDKNRLTNEIDTVEEKMSNLANRLLRVIYEWKTNLKTVQNIDIMNNQAAYLQTIYILEDRLESLDNTVKVNPYGIEESTLLEIRELMNDYKDIIGIIYHDTRTTLKDLDEKLTRLNKEIKNLKSGIMPFDNSLTELRNDIANDLLKKYGEKVEVSILCELLEIKNKDWQNAIEAYLHTQKFYLIIEPQYFLDALKIYDELKFRKKYFDIGIVDIEKLMRLDKGARAENNSLAKEVHTDSLYARAYIDHVLGKVIKCHNVESIRKYNIAITPTCMLYQNFVARQLNPSRWSIPYIGKGSIERQIQIKQTTIEELQPQNEKLQSLSNLLNKIKSIEAISESDVNNICIQIKEAMNIEGKKKQLKEVIKKMSELEAMYIIDVDKKINETESEKLKINDNITETSQEIGAIKRNNESIEGEKIGEQEEIVKLINAKISKEYDEDWVHIYGETRFIKELETKNKADNVLNIFMVQLRKTETIITYKKEELVNLRANYNGKHRLEFDINAEDNIKLSTELLRLKNTEMPKYEQSIVDSREKAYRQFQEDFISKLKLNIETVENQIEELNKSLKGNNFGKDRYYFKVDPKPDYRKFYDMITDKMLLDGYNLFSNEFQVKHQEAINELFKQIVDIGQTNITAGRKEELEKNLAKYTDFKTYLNFDLKVINENNIEERLSKTLAKKSGGETQTPFYICVLASFAQLYRVKDRGEFSNTMRLIVFDEAFSKMDHERIQDSIKLLRKMDLQAILCAPTEKISDIAPLVDRNLLVTRISGQTIVKAFDPKEILED